MANEMKLKKWAKERRSLTVEIVKEKYQKENIRDIDSYWSMLDEIWTNGLTRYTALLSKMGESEPTKYDFYEGFGIYIMLKQLTIEVGYSAKNLSDRRKKECRGKKMAYDSTAKWIGFFIKKNFDIDPEKFFE